MKWFDFLKTGGEPFAQDDLEYLQLAYTESITALASAGVSGGAPTQIKGALVSNVGTAFTITAGWIFYNGYFIRVPGNSVTVSGGQAAYVSIVKTEGPLTYASGATYNVIDEATAALVAETAGTADVAGTLFLASELVAAEWPNPALAASVATLLAWMGTINGGWYNDTFAMAVEAGGGTVTIGTVSYNKYQQVGSTYFWQAYVTGCSVTGSPTVLRLKAAGVYASGGAWECASTGGVGGYIMCGYATSSSGWYPVIGQMNLDGSGNMVLDINISIASGTGGDAWSAPGTFTLSLNLCTGV